jgi:formyltetrahydrofolate deformylase
VAASSSTLWSADISKSFVLTLSCPERLGIMHALTTFLVSHGCDITEHQQFDDPYVGRLFLRTCFTTPDSTVTVDSLDEVFKEIGAEFQMAWRLYDADVRDRMIVMVSKSDHCLNDLLYRWRTSTLGADIAAVVSNHPDLRTMVEAAGLPFHHVPVSADNKAAAEDELRQVVSTYEVSTIVLARYMQILSDSLAKDFYGRAINIHHSFLPSFAGAKPYHQAYDRGVKLVGATAHYVTADLDEGPIIEQVVAEIDHRHGAQDLARVGRDSECRALSRAVTWHAEHRILLNGTRTIVFK